MNLKVKEWPPFVYSILAILVIVFTAGGWAGDLRWVKVGSLQDVSDKLNSEVAKIEINALDRQITFLQIKIDQEEATNSEKIYIKALQQQLRQLQAK